jgi:hypothetical protein
MLPRNQPQPLTLMKQDEARADQVWEPAASRVVTQRLT